MARDPAISKANPKVRLGFRWKRWFLGFGLFLLLVVLFQKAILLAAIRWEIGHYAAGQKWELQCEISGDPIHYIEINGLDLRMAETDALQSLKIKRVKATYNIIALIFSGWSHALGDVEVDDATLVLREAAPNSDPENTSIWVPFPNSLVLKNFNLERGALQITQMNLELFEEQTGKMSVTGLNLPGLGHWKNVSSLTGYKRGVINLGGLELAPFLNAQNLRLDGKDLADKKIGIKLEGLLFGGQTDLAAEWQQRKEGDFYKISTRIRNLSLDQASDFLKPEETFGGRAETLNLDFTGLWQDRKSWDGTIQASLKNGTVGGASAWESFVLDADLKTGGLEFKKAVLTVDERNGLQGQGKMQLVEPYAYQGELNGKLEDLSSLQGLLELTGIKELVQGKLEVNWSGEGRGGMQLQAQHKGKGYVLLQGVSYGETLGIEAELRGDYTPERAAFQTVRASAAGWRLTAAGGWANRRLDLQDLQFFRGEKQLLKGTVNVPFYPGEWRNPGLWLSPEDPINIQLQGQGIQLGALLQELGSKSPWKGEVSIDLNASGTLKDLQAKGNLEIKNLGSGLNPDFLPAQLKGDLQIQQGQLNVSAIMTQPSLQPVKFWGNAPFNAVDFLNGNEDWKKNPLRAELAMASMDLDRVKRFFPQILELRGKTGADVHLAGSFDNPMLWGEINIDIPRLRFNHRSIPNLTGFVTRLKFDKRRMQVETMRGDLAGGPFQMTGTMDFSKLSDPIMDMRLNGTDLLLYRDDHVTSRANVVLNITGPFKKAKVAGTLALTKSQFFRNIDILPIGLPGRSAPELQGSVLPQFSIKVPPIRDWTFDVATSNKDPFLIKGNLANGRIDAKLHLTGTGLAPALDGGVSVTNLEATLPFSTMLIDRGYLSFKPDQGLNATLDFRGTSKIQDYLVTVYVYGTLLRPQTLFVSQPPLSEQDIVALIATGSTTSELTSNSSVIAGKATSLLFQKIWRKLFPNAKVSKNELLDRVSFSVGSIDPNSDAPSIGASLKVTDDIYLIFDSGTEGSFRGRVKYLIRFR